MSDKPLNEQMASAVGDMVDAMDPEILEAIADEIESFEHSARAYTLRLIAKKQREAVERALSVADAVVSAKS